jgi:hypothetical protein
VGVFVLRLLDQNSGDAVALLYTLPIALLALTFGRTVGLAAGLLGVLLVVGWGVIVQPDIGPLGWVARLLPQLLLGYLLGDAADRVKVANEHRAALEVAQERHLAAVEVNDTLVQGMAAAMWSLDAGRTEAGMATLRETLELGHELVSKLLRDADAGPGGTHRPGSTTGAS